MEKGIEEIVGQLLEDNIIFNERIDELERRARPSRMAIVLWRIRRWFSHNGFMLAILFNMLVLYWGIYQLNGRATRMDDDLRALDTYMHSRARR